MLVPGEAVDAYPARIQAVCATVWTPDVVAAFAEARAAREAAALAPPQDEPRFPRARLGASRSKSKGSPVHGGPRLFRTQHLAVVLAVFARRLSAIFSP